MPSLVAPRLTPYFAVSAVVLFSWQAVLSNAAVTPSGDTTIAGSFIVVGQQAYGTLQVTDSSVVQSNTTIVGDFQTGFGVLTVDQGVYQNNGQTTVGDQGIGTLRIRNQGVYSTHALVAADSGSATITVEGEGSLLQVTQNQFELGRGGSARLDVLDKATVMSNDLFVGNSNITIDGGALLSTSLAAIGGSSIVEVLDGRFETEDLSITGPGNSGQVGAPAEVRVAGPNARIDAFSVGIGVTGEGTLRVSNGGLVSTSSTSTLYIGRNPGAVGRLFLDGADSRFVSPAQMILGDRGYGQFTLSGGALHNTQQVLVGGNDNGRGLLEVLDAGTRLTVLNSFGVNALAEAFVDNGATLTARRVTVAGELSVNGGTIDAAEQGFDLSGRLSGHGRLIGGIGVGGELEATGGELRVAGVLNTFNTGGQQQPRINVDHATLIVEGTSRIEPNTAVRLSAGNIDVRSTLGQPAALWVLGDVVVTPGPSQFFGTIRNDANGTFTHAPGSDTIYYDDVQNFGDILVAEGAVVTMLGELSGNGASGGGLVRLEGNVSPGFSPGLMEFGGDAELGQQSFLNLEIQGLTPGQEFDQITVAGGISLDGALNVQVESPLSGAGGSLALTVIDAATISGQFSDTPSIGESVGSGWRFGGLDYDTANGDVILNLIAGIEGDFNNDGAVNAADYTLWRDHLGEGAGTLANDYTGLPIGPEQYAIWQANYGQSLGLAAAQLTSTPAPEPTAIALLAVMSVGCRPRRAR
ncbi:MAG: hypothetical protein KDA37_03890 [Planctomycetales bacterium]|nr:hypothetical protein [Planctomycetales bacterium]